VLTYMATCAARITRPIFPHACCRCFLCHSQSLDLWSNIKTSLVRLRLLSCSNPALVTRIVALLGYRVLDCHQQSSYPMLHLHFEGENRIVAPAHVDLHLQNEQTPRPHCIPGHSVFQASLLHSAAPPPSCTPPDRGPSLFSYVGSTSSTMEKLADPPSYLLCPRRILVGRTPPPRRAGSIRGEQLRLEQGSGAAGRLDLRRRAAAGGAGVGRR
jgi:hypothetical protein